MMNNQEFEVTEKEVLPIQVASIRWKGKYSDSGKAFSKLGRAAGMNINGKPMGLYYDMEYKEDGADIESCFPVKKKIETDLVKTRELPKGRCVTLIHKGPYDQLSRSYGRVFEYIKVKNLTTTAPI